MARGKVVQSEKRELASLSRGKIRPGETDEWTNEQLYVPPLPPTNLRGCHLIKISYDVYVSIDSLQIKMIINPNSNSQNRVSHFWQDAKLNLPTVSHTIKI